MKMFKNMKIWVRFVLSFSLILLFMIVIILVSINKIKHINDQLTYIVKLNNVRIQLSNTMIDDSRESALIVRNVLLAKYEHQSDENIQKNIDELTRLRKTYHQVADSLEALIPSEDTKGLEILKEVHAHAGTAKFNQDSVIRFVLDDKVSEGTNFMFGMAYPSVTRWIKETQDLVHYNEDRNAFRYQEALVAHALARNTVIILGLLAILLSMVIAYFLSMSITKPLKLATNLVLTRDMTLDLSGYQRGGGELGIMIQTFIRDISERVKLEKDMRSASIYVRNLIEANLDSLVAINAEGIITDVNNASVNIFGVSKEKLIGSDAADYFTEPEKVRAGYQLVFSQGIVRDYPLTIRHASGQTIDVLYNASVYKDEAGQVQGVLAAARDITETKRQENELKAYKDQLEEMVSQRTAELTNVLAEVKETINVLASSSTEILTATTQVATGTAETATAISETSTTVEEVQQASKLSSQKAKNVADSAQRVVQVFQNGQKAVDETINGINKIREQMDSIAQTVVRLSEQSQSIGGIIASVTDIADQSNLLAVNAAIEAAKAGEQGRGFAVVAQEIKNLAGQSKQATLQVRNILNDIQKVTGAAVMATEQGSKAVESGLKQSMQAGEAIRILAESSNEAVQAATQIVASSQQQVIGMDQIGIAMQNINQAGTETAVSMVQAEKSAKSLYELSQKLRGMVEKFQG